MNAFQASVAVAAAMVLQLALLYVPNLNTAFAALESKIKFLLILGLDLLCALVVYGFFAYACPLIPSLSCIPVTPDVLVGTVVMLGQSFLANVGLQQMVYQGIRLTGNIPADVMAAKPAA